MQICWGLKATQNYKTLRIHGFVVKLHGWQTEPFTDKIIQQLQGSPKVILSPLKKLQYR
jgi:hypothetical protein